jgi:hypothetical protein
MDTDSKEELSIDDKRVTSCHIIRSYPVSLKTAEAMRKRSQSGMCHTRSNRNMSVMLPFIGLPPGLAAPHYCMLIHLLVISDIFKNFLVLMLVQEPGR